MYHLRLYGPNGFFREFIGDKNDPAIEVSCRYSRDMKDVKGVSGNIMINISNPESHALTILVTDNAYRNAGIEKQIAAGIKNFQIPVDLIKSSGWYDFSVKIQGNSGFERRYAGRVETGSHSISDPLMGGVI
jgi:phospholipase C